MSYDIDIRRGINSERKSEMGMTDNQFKGFRRIQLSDYEEMLEIALMSNADKNLIRKIEKLIADARADVEA